MDKIKLEYPWEKEGNIREEFFSDNQFQEIVYDLFTDEENKDDLTDALKAIDATLSRKIHYNLYEGEYEKYIEAIIKSLTKKSITLDELETYYDYNFNTWNSMYNVYLEIDIDKLKGLIMKEE